jgi:mRNA interferase YafQ
VIFGDLWESIQMLTIKPATQFKKDIKKFKHNRQVINKLHEVLKILAHGKPLPSKYQDHNLSGNWKGFRECHVQPDALLIYLASVSDNILTLVRFGSHAELFK